MPNILVTRPEDDRTTKYISTWALEFIQEAKKRSYTVLDLHKDRATRKQVESMLAKRTPALAFFNGHGNETMITGYEMEPLIIAGENEEFLKEIITYALSCSCGKILGPQSVVKGAKAFIGYNSPFVLFWNQDTRTLPLNDNLAKNFLEPSNLLVLSLLKGHTVEESVAVAKKAYLANVLKFSASNASDIELASLPFLFRNSTSLAYYGIGTATI